MDLPTDDAELFLQLAQKIGDERAVERYLKRPLSDDELFEGPLTLLALCGAGKCIMPVPLETMEGASL